MKISIISDIHVHPNREGGLEILQKFCDSKIVKKSDIIVFLGDIFDLMVYEFEDYREFYKEALIELDKLPRGKIYYVEGNHDFMVKKILNGTKAENSLNYFSNGFSIVVEGKKFHFCHGDTIEIENNVYLFYRKIIKSKIAKFIYESIIGFDKTWEIGSYLLRKSHIRHERYSTENDYEKIRNKFRRSADVFFEKNDFDYLICGHSHVKDEYSSQSDKKYYNNGYAQYEKTFLYYNGKKFEFLEL